MRPLEGIRQRETPKTFFFYGGIDSEGNGQKEHKQGSHFPLLKDIVLLKMFIL